MATSTSAWNGPSSGPATAKKTRVTRYTMDRKPPYTLDPKSAKLIIEWPSDGHNGGALAFGHDGMLYVTSGDGTSDSDTNIVGQDMTQADWPRCCASTSIIPTRARPTRCRRTIRSSA